MLAGVSRTFALTIPQLPEALRDVVSNAYLLCRIVDTIEDEPGLSADQKRSLCALFLTILETDKDPALLISELAPKLTHHAIPAEHELIRQLDRVVAITKSFAPPQRQALIRCVRIMSEGMIYFQENAKPEGLENQAEMDKYCYHVAGIVGEMLTDLFCYYSEEINQQREQLFQLSSSFGQGLQMTNILKDIWDDQERGACWLPRDLFEEKGLKLTEISSLANHPKYQSGLEHLLGVAHYHLENALRYTLLLPAKEKGIREFCLWALGMAMLTLRKIHRNPGFTEGSQVKISRNSVKATIAITGMAVSQNSLLKLLFRILGSSLPKVKTSNFVMV
jgi:farnesyl-diphosphate farnesyltransferase